MNNRSQIYAKHLKQSTKRRKNSVFDECFYVKNGFAYDYYRNRVYTNSKSFVTSTQLTNIHGTYVTKSNASANANYYYVGAYGTGNAYGSQTIYKNGYVGDIDTRAMMMYFTASANKGCLKAIDELCDIYQNGYGDIEPNKKQLDKYLGMKR